MWKCQVVVKSMAAIEYSELPILLACITCIKQILLGLLLGLLGAPYGVVGGIVWAIVLGIIEYVVAFIVVHYIMRKA